MIVGENGFGGIGVWVASVGIGGTPYTHLGNCLFAVSKNENSGFKGNMQYFERFPKGALNGMESSPNGFNTSPSFEDSENYPVRVLIKNGELEEGLRTQLKSWKFWIRLEPLLMNNVNALIGGYCKSGDIKEAWLVLDRMSVAPNADTYDTIFHSFYDREIEASHGST
ncbi:unnamed protein product [Sphenostylis stenocarpa]|uniref:Pentatricopeptide repeat-containing protein n=1 Tax=Sphenostylis stenocarpa TaxID=92480 RepID=A0AA86VRI8_9FABA|nr:unnamed protein product [Sphenostylis stenocarpa]